MLSEENPDILEIVKGYKEHRNTELLLKELKDLILEVEKDDINGFDNEEVTKKIQNDNINEMNNIKISNEDINRKEIDFKDNEDPNNDQESDDNDDNDVKQFYIKKK